MQCYICGRSAAYKIQTLHQLVPICVEHVISSLKLDTDFLTSLDGTPLTLIQTQNALKASRQEILRRVPNQTPSHSTMSANSSTKPV